MAAELLSIKNTNPPSAFGDTEFAADRFFNLFVCAAVLRRQLVRRLTGLNCCGDNLAYDRSATYPAEVMSA